MHAVSGVLLEWLYLVLMTVCMLGRYAIEGRNYAKVKHVGEC